MATGTGNLPYTMPPVSPFDVITSQAENERIANIESLADGTGIGDKAVTLPAINGGSTAGVLTTDASGNVSATGNYSTSEVSTKTTWIDGKTIYKKTISLGSLPNNGAKLVAHGVTGIADVVNISGCAKSGSVIIPLPFVSTNLTAQVSVNINGSNIEINTGVDRTALSGYITILYTKTT